jgi:hypothetical protein
VSALAWLYVLGAAVELLGLGLVAEDVRASSRTLKEMSDPTWGAQQYEAHEPVRSIFAIMAEVSAGNLARRAAGVALIACGMIVQTVANVWAL